MQNGGHCQPGYYSLPPHIAAHIFLSQGISRIAINPLRLAYYNWRARLLLSRALCYHEKDYEKIQQENPDIGATIAVVTKEDGESPLCVRECEKGGLTLNTLRVGAAEGAIVQRNAASLWPYKLVALVLERQLVAGGFNLQTNTLVTGLKRVDMPSGLSSSHTDDSLKAASGGWTVHTSRGDISARHVVLATNAYTSHMLPQLADIIVPVRGQVSSLKPPPAKGPLDIGYTFYFVSDLDDRRDDYLVQRPPPGAELIYGGGRIRAEGHGLGVWDDSTVDKRVAEYLKGELSGLMDLSIREQETIQGEHEILQKQDIEPTFKWSGIMGFSRDGWPWVGSVPDSAGGGDGLWLCAGYSGGGMPNAALCAKTVVDMMILGHEDEGEVADEIDLPREYLFTEDRLESSRARETVAEADERGEFI